MATSFLGVCRGCLEERWLVDGTNLCQKCHSVYQKHNHIIPTVRSEEALRAEVGDEAFARLRIMEPEEVKEKEDPEEAAVERQLGIFHKRHPLPAPLKRVNANHCKNCGSGFEVRHCLCYECRLAAGEEV